MGYQTVPQGCRQEGRRLGQLFGGQHQVEDCQVLKHLRSPTHTPHPARGRPPSRLCGRDSFPPPLSRVPVFGSRGWVPEAGSPRPALQPRPPSDGGAAPGNGALTAPSSYQLDAAGPPRRFQLAHPADPSGRPSKHDLDPNLRQLYTDVADRTGIAERGPRDHGDPDRASSGEQAGSPSLRRGRQELLGP